VRRALVAAAIGWPVVCMLAFGLSFVLPWTTTDAHGKVIVGGPGAGLFYLSLFGSGALGLVTVLGCVVWGLLALARRTRNRRSAG